MVTETRQPPNDDEDEDEEEEMSGPDSLQYQARDELEDRHKREVRIVKEHKGK